jgi:hypothetical protein
MSEQWDGRPQNPERDGWHWLTRAEDGLTIPKRWDAEMGAWEDGIMLSPPTVIEWGVNYAGPCLTPAEVAAQVEAARRDEREANAALIDCGCDNRDAVLARLESRGELYAAYLCQQGSACCALEAATIRARGDA